MNFFEKNLKHFENFALNFERNFILFDFYECFVGSFL